MAPRGLRMALALAAAATSLPAADAQFLRGMFRRGDGTSSYFSSSTWTLGQDGEMHEKVQKMSSEVMDTPHGPQRVEKRMVCKDGYCREEMVIQSARGPEAEAMVLPPVPPSIGMGFRPREIMERLMGRQRGPAPPTIEVVAVPAPLPQRTPELVEIAPPGIAKPFALRGMLQRLAGGPRPHVDVEVVRAPPPHADSAVATRPLAISCLIASSVLLAMLVTTLRLQWLVSARELPMRGALAEPLASAEGAAPSGPAAPAPAKKEAEADVALTSTRFYLEGLYAQVVAKAEHHSIAKYLGTVYARAAA